MRLLLLWFRPKATRCPCNHDPHPTPTWDMMVGLIAFGLMSEESYEMVRILPEARQLVLARTVACRMVSVSWWIIAAHATYFPSSLDMGCERYM